MTPQIWAATAAVVYLTGLTVLFGVRTWQHQRATGDTGFAGFRGRGGWALAAGLLFVTAVLLGAAALVLAARGIVPVHNPAPLTMPLAPLGLAVTAVGLVLAWAAQSAMGASWRIGVDPTESTSLVTMGIFLPSIGRRRPPHQSASLPANSR